MATQVTCVDTDKPEVTEIQTIEDDWLIVCDGRAYLHHITKHANGTAVITVKIRPVYGESLE